ncbi:MFS transporter [Dyella choica]|uniref:Lysosomal dipeptide transporter MFSD1 n=1 Tax=Dyella choica TaxID=1927959 RepID=A0A432M2H6_9GAMM|nr:MFS transporter [Dyella choica]RUL72468.1 MFS transporter [Dyella choica]
MNVKSVAIQAGKRLAIAYAIAWGFAAVFYFLEYASRSAPAVMLPELSKAFAVTTLGVSTILGYYYYTYSTTSLVAGVLLDRFGARYVAPAGMALLAMGCVLFAIPDASMGSIGRLLQGAGSAFAFTGAVYLASRGFSAKRLATAIGFTQCFGMLGGTMGQIAVGPLIHGLVSTAQFWMGMGVVVLLVAVGLLLMTPREDHAAKAGEKRSLLGPYKVVLSNPQSYICGIVAGLLFAPTTIGDMVWGVRLFQEDRLFSYHDAVFAISMVPFGWVFGCPLFGWLADALHRRKLALLIGVSAMLACALQLTFLPGALPSWITLLVFGISSGAAMIPYTIIKEVNPDHVKGSATGAINFITFSVTALLGPVFSKHIGKTMGAPAINPEFHFFESGLFWVAVIALALLVSFTLRETGKRPEQGG